MKKLLFPTFFWMVSFALSAQPAIIQYATHALIAGQNNAMTYCEYSDPGSTGENVVWDFQKLKPAHAFMGYVRTSAEKGNQSLFSQSNTELEEFESRFYFDVNQKQIVQYGYVSVDGKTIVKYQTPFIKMKYPFAFGDFYSGSLNGSYEYQGIKSADIMGDYSVQADAFGTLQLPENKIFNNTLRVKTIKNFSTTFSNATQKTEIITYRWYNAQHRYPLLTLTQINTKVGNNTSTSYQAAYNSDALNSPYDKNANIHISEFQLLPNPVKDQLMVQFTVESAGVITFNIYNLAGSLEVSIEREIEAGTNAEIDLSDEILGLSPGKYILVTGGNYTRIAKEFTLIE